jgi:adenosine deaminase
VIPKAELHVHVEGTMGPELARRIAQRNRRFLPSGIARGDSWQWKDFLSFLEVYDRAASVIRTAQDYRDIVYEYLVACAAEGAIYVELTASADHAAEVGLSDAEHLAGLAQGIDDARGETGIEARIVMSCVRHFGPERAIEVAQRTVDDLHPYVTGFGMGGDEAGYPPQLFRRAFEIAAEAGLGITCHAGEWGGPESVRAALELPNLTRIGHGVRSIEDPALVREIADRGIVLEVCLTSNVVLGLYADYGSHPLRQLVAAGVRTTLGSDDPPYWHASIGREYEVAQEMGLDPHQFTQFAIESAFLPAAERAALRDRLPAAKLPEEE